MSRDESRRGKGTKDFRLKHHRGGGIVIDLELGFHFPAKTKGWRNTWKFHFAPKKKGKTNSDKGYCLHLKHFV